MKLIIVLIQLFISSTVFAQLEFLLPTSTTGSVIKHNGYTFSYSEDHEQAEWVAYELTSTKARGGFERTNDFRVDMKCPNVSAYLSDYKGSGYDRGHLAPAGDMAYSSTAMSESFYMSNICPQNPSFNRGIWRALESQVRTWAVSEEAVVVITGPILTINSKTIGSNKVTVPKNFYKIILDYTEPELKAIAFLLPNLKGTRQLYEYVVTIDSLETLTSIDFFPGLPDELEEQLESTISTDAWSFETITISNNNDGEAKQCLGQTLNGRRCNRKTTNDLQYCWQHESQINESNKIKKLSGSVQCKGMTQDGDRCNRKTTNTSHYCWQHKNQYKSKPFNTYQKKTITASRCTAETQSGSRCKRKTKNSSGKCWQHE